MISADCGGVWWADTPQDEWPPEQMQELEPIWDDEIGHRRQELVIIGQDLKVEEVTAALDACLLSDAELQQGPDSWLLMTDPFNPWDIDGEEGESEEQEGEWEE